MKEAIGLIEAVGLAAAVEAADTCLKSANVKLIGYELTKGGGYVTIKISGDVGAVSAAVTAASAAAMKVRGVYSTKVIPRPSESLEMMMNSKETVGRIQGNAAEGTSVSESTSNAPDVETAEQGTEEAPPSDEEAATQDGQPDPEPVPESQDALEDDDLSELEEISPGVTCNICHNPACDRLKGEPRTKCITYKR